MPGLTACPAYVRQHVFTFPGIEYHHSPILRLGLPKCARDRSSRVQHLRFCTLEIFGSDCFLKIKIFILLTMQAECLIKVTLYAV